MNYSAAFFWHFPKGGVFSICNLGNEKKFCKKYPMYVNDIINLTVTFIYATLCNWLSY